MNRSSTTSLASVAAMASAMASTWTRVRRLVSDVGQVHDARRVGAGRIQARPHPVGQVVLARQQDDARLAGPDGGPIETCAAMSNDIRLFPSPSSPSRTASSPSETCGPAKTNARASAARWPGARTPTRRGTGRVAPVRGRSAAGPSRGRTRSPQALPAATMASNAHPERQASGQRPSSSGRIDSEASQSSCAGHRALQPASRRPSPCGAVEQVVNHCGWRRAARSRRRAGWRWLGHTHDHIPPEKPPYSLAKMHPRNPIPEQQTGSKERRERLLAFEGPAARRVVFDHTRHRLAGAVAPS